LSAPCGQRGQWPPFVSGYHNSRSPGLLYSPLGPSVDGPRGHGRAGRLNIFAVKHYMGQDTRASRLRHAVQFFAFTCQLTLAITLRYARRRRTSEKADDGHSAPPCGMVEQSNLVRPPLLACWRAVPSTTKPCLHRRSTHGENAKFCRIDRGYHASGTLPRTRPPGRAVYASARSVAGLQPGTLTSSTHVHRRGPTLGRDETREESHVNFPKNFSEEHDCGCECGTGRAADLGKWLRRLRRCG
jgi:hypothetical protein